MARSSQPTPNEKKPQLRVRTVAFAAVPPTERDIVPVTTHIWFPPLSRGYPAVIATWPFKLAGSTGFAVVQLLGWDHLPIHPEPWKIEIDQQVSDQVGHWHHYYGRKELEIILEHGMSVPYYQVRQRGTFMWVAWCNSLDAFSPT